MSKINLLDLFSGIGGFAQGLTQAGFEIENHYFSEIEKHPIAIYRNKFKEAEYAGSVTDVRGDRLPKINAITFGSPCQDFSLAGKREGIEGERSSLVREAIRLIDECRPDFFIWENVKGVFSSNDGADFWAVVQALADIGGYRLEWQLLNTAWFLPQNRERVYLVGSLGEGSGGTVFPLKPKPCGTDEGSEQARNIRTLTAGGNSGGMHSSMTLIQSFGRNEKQKVRIKNNPKHCNTILSHYAKDPSENMIHVAAQRGRNPERPSDRTAGAPMRQTLEINHNGTTNTLTSVAKDNYVVEPYIENENLSGQRFRNSYAGTLRANASHNYQTVNSIRRLTEVECERLQGFSDGWTEYGDYEGVIKKVPATARYKALGNAVTVDVVQAVGEAILEATA